MAEARGLSGAKQDASAAADSAAGSAAGSLAAVCGCCCCRGCRGHGEHRVSSACPGRRLACLAAFPAGGTNPNGNPVAKEQWCELLAESGHQVVADSHACLSSPVIDAAGRQPTNWAEFVDLDSDGARDPGEPDAATPPVDHNGDGAFDSPGVPATLDPAAECIPAAARRCAAEHTAVAAAANGADRLAAVAAVARCLRGP